MEIDNNITIFNTNMYLNCLKRLKRKYSVQKYGFECKRIYFIIIRIDLPI